MDGDAGLIEPTAAAETAVCLWCEREFEPRKGGSPQRFCQTKCRNAFHSAGRRFAERAVLCEQLTVAELRGDPLEACMVRGGEDRLLVERRPVAPETMLTEAQRASVRNLALELSINAEGIVDLCTLGWLEPEGLQDPGAVGDAAAELTNAAISLRLRPSGDRK